MSVHGCLANPCPICHPQAFKPVAPYVGERPLMAVLFGFLDWLAANVAYNGAGDEGQRFYDWGVNAWLQEQAAEYLLAQPTADEAEGEREALAIRLHRAFHEAWTLPDPLDLYVTSPIWKALADAALATPPAPERNGLGGGSENPDSHEWLGTDR